MLEGMPFAATAGLVWFTVLVLAIGVIGSVLALWLPIFVAVALGRYLGSAAVALGPVVALVAVTVLDFYAPGPAGSPAVWQLLTTKGVAGYNDDHGPLIIAWVFALGSYMFAIGCVAVESMNRVD